MTDDHNGCKVLTMRGGGIVAEFHTPECQARTSATEGWTDAPGCICDSKHGMKPTCPVHGESGNLGVPK